jgi:cytochrome P450
MKTGNVPYKSTSISNDENIQKGFAQNFDLKNLPEDFFENPYPYYDALIKFAPVKKLPDGGYFLTRYKDLDFVYRNPEIFSSDKRVLFKANMGDSLLYEHHTHSLVFNDPPLHTRVRKLIGGALSPKAIQLLEPGLVDLVDRLLDNLSVKFKAVGYVDLISEFASAIPIEIIGNLLGVPLEDRGPLRDWSLSILGALEPILSPQVFDKGNQSVADFTEYLKYLIAARRENPGDPSKDVLTRLIQGEQSGEKLSELELIHNCIFLLNAGHETTTNLIGNGLVLLMSHSAQRDQLLNNPNYAQSAVEEILRFESSNQLGNRMTVREVMIGDELIPANSQITLCMGAANRDDEKFASPNLFDISRTHNKHLAFAGGIHTCAGMGLARLEGEIAIGAFFRKFPNATISEPPELTGRVRFRGYSKIIAKLEMN